VSRGPQPGGGTDFVSPRRSAALQLVAGRGHYDAIISAVQNATASVWIATANLKELLIEDWRARPGVSRNMTRPPDYRSVLGVLDDLAASGVELRMLAATLPSRPFRAEFDKHKRLVAGGLDLRTCPRVHLKTVVVDASLCYLGSANWTGAGLGAKGSGRRNFELGVMTSDDGVIDEVQGLYDRIWRGAACEGCRLRAECPDPLDGGRFAASAGGRAPARKTRRRSPAAASPKSRAGRRSGRRSPSA
jgi:phosphatidylserine/phosphatidylglycerophosphate/cardiolipin synthase-like enzyme